MKFSRQAIGTISEPPKWVFSTTINHRAMKLGTLMQVSNTITSAKIQGHRPIITSFSSRICGIQYLPILLRMTLLECNSVEKDDIYIMNLHLFNIQDQQ